MTRLKQALIIAVGLVLAGAMALLGVWQLDVYHSQGDRTAEERAAAPPLDLRTAAPAGAAVRDGFGRTVRFTGEYDPRLQVLVPLDSSTGSFRVLSALRQSDGSLVPVVRGVTRADQPPAPPRGPLTQQGVLLPSENDAPPVPTEGTQLNAVRLPVLAQRWPGLLVDGFVTLPAVESAAQGLEPAPLALPQGRGRLRNAAYALQWWLFGAFAVLMAVRIARDVGLQDDLEAQVRDDAISAEAT